MNDGHTKSKSVSIIALKALLLCTVFALISEVAFAGQVTASVFKRSPNGQKRNVSVKFENEPLGDALHALARKVKVGISYNAKTMPEKLITYRAKNASVYKVLDAILAGTGLYAALSENRKVFLIKESPIMPKVQQETITGTVTDAGNGQTLPGVNILVKGTTNGTSTDANGAFELIVESLQDTLVVSFVGFQRQEVPINGRGTVDIAMQTQTITGEELVVTALGFKERAAESTSSSSQISSESLSRSGSSDLLGGMSAKASGLSITKSSGRPGASSRVLIRGQVSLQGDNQPLFVVDGVPIDNSTIGASDAGFYQQSRVNDLNQDDIESVQVLKGPSAAAIWGSRAANGVIVITTKQGSNLSNKLNVGFKSGLTLTEVNRTVDMQRKFGQGFDGEYEWGSRYSWGDKIADRSGAEDVRARPDFPYSRIIEKNSQQTFNHSTDYLKTGKSYDNELSLSGGDENSTFFMSFSHKDQNGYLKTGSGLNSSSVRGNFTQDFTSDIKASLKINYIRKDADRVPKSNATAGVNIGAYRTPPDFDQHPYSINYIDENGNQFPNRHRAYRNPDGSQLNPGYSNPFWVMNNVNSNSLVNRVLGNTQVEYDPTSWLNFTERLGIDYYTDERNNFYPKRGAGVPFGSVSVNDYSNYQINSDLIARASHQFSEDYSGSILLGWNFNQRNYSSSNSSTSDLILSDVSPILDNGRSFGVGSYKSIQRTSALYSVLKFSAFDQVNLKFTGRSESASTYGSNTDNTYFYPSASIAWQFSELDLFENIGMLNFGKIRASYGVTGVQPDVYKTQTLYEIASFADWSTDIESVYYGGGTELDNLRGNDKLKPELVTEYEFGIDLAFLDDRINLSATQYFTNTERAILNLDVAPTTGFTNTVENGAELENIGTELELNVDWLRSGDFIWETGINWTTNRSKVTNLAGVTNVALKGPFDISVSNSAIEGEPFGVLYGRTFARNENGDYVLNSNGFPQLAPGFDVIGDPNPDWTMGISNTVSYKSFTVSALLDIKQGGDNYNGTKGVQKFFGVQGDQTWETTTDQDLVNYNGEVIPGGTTFRGYVEDFGNGPVAIDQAWFVNGLGGGFSGANEQFVEDAGYVRIRNISLSYNLASQSFKKKSGLSSLGFTITAYNPVLWTNYSGVDPETDVSGPGNGRGLDYFNPPGTRSLTFSININY